MTKVLLASDVDSLNSLKVPKLVRGMGVSISSLAHKSDDDDDRSGGLEHQHTLVSWIIFKKTKVFHANLNQINAAENLQILRSKLLNKLHLPSPNESFMLKTWYSSRHLAHLSLNAIIQIVNDLWLAWNRRVSIAFLTLMIFYVNFLIHMIIVVIAHKLLNWEWEKSNVLKNQLERKCCIKVITSLMHLEL